MKKIIALFLVLSLLCFPQFGASMVFAEEPEADRPMQSAAALADAAASLGDASPEPEAPEARPAGYSSPETAGPGLEPAAVQGSREGDNDFSYTLEDGVLRVIGSGPMPDYEYGKAPWFESRSTIQEVVLSDGITSVGTYAFCRLSNLKKATIPASVTVLKGRAFAECSSLKEVSELTNVTELGYGAFALCYALEEVAMPSITVLGDYVFQDTKITSFQIPLGMHEFNPRAFFGVKLQEISVAPGHAEYKTQDGVLFTADGKTLILYPAGRADTSYAVPAGTEMIGNSAFGRASKLQSIDLGNVSSLGYSSFQQCTALKQIKIPDSVNAVDYYAFYDCYSLESVRFGSGLRATGYGMFEECSRLNDVDFGTALRVIDGLCFAYTGLTTLDLPAQIEEVKNGAFAECRKLQRVHLRGYPVIAFQTFMNDTTLSELILEEGTLSINRASFYNCPKLQTVTVPASCTYVDSTAFPMTTVIHCLGENMYPYGYNGYRALDQLRITGVQEYDNAYAVLEQVNARRAENGLEPLVMEQELLSAAMCRAGECALLFAHTRPDSSICFSACSKMSGENVAAGQGTPDAVMDSWMNSNGHRENILNENYHTIGIGCFLIGGVRFWVQCFGGDTAGADCAQPANATVSQIISVCPESFEDAPAGNGVVFSYGSDSYEFKLSLTAEQTMLNLGDSTSLTVKVKNPGFKSFLCPIDPDGLCWTSSNPSVAAVDAGTVSTVGAGVTEITAAGLRGFLSEKLALRVLPSDCSGGHSWDDGVVLTAPTCTEEGVGRYTCLVCGTTENQALAALGHDYAPTVYYPTGTDEGFTRYTCTRCGDQYDADFTPPIEPDQAVYFSGVCGPELTWTLDTYNCHLQIQGRGEMTNYIWENSPWFELRWYVRSVSCQAEMTGIGEYAFRDCDQLTKVVLSEGLDHIGECAFYACSKLETLTIPNSVTTINGCAFNKCSKLQELTFGSGLTSLGDDAVSYCVGLNTVRFLGNAPAIAKYAFWGVNANAFYYADTEGWTDEVKKNYGGNLVWKPMCRVHNYQSSVTPPTCTEQGCTSYTCSVCGNSYTDDYVPALGHDWGDWRETTAPTCTEPGEKIHTCSRCQAAEAERVEALGHDLIRHEAQTPTCTEIGWDAYDTCSRCDYSTYAEKAALGHAWAESVVITEPTCTESGCITYVCTRCGDSYTDNEAPALGHAWDDGVVITEPKHLTPGAKKFTCTRCQETETREIPRLANPFVDVHETDFFFNPVMWALDETVTGGVDDTHFAPERTVMRGDAMVFFWAAKGRPEFTGTDKTFKDVKKKHWAYPAVMWAVENGITGGTDAAGLYFSPSRTCTRSEILQFLYAAMEKPEYTIDNPYSDVKDKHWYYDGAIWAYEKGLEKGENGKFKAKTPCTRGYVVTYLYRFMTGNELAQ